MSNQGFSLGKHAVWHVNGTETSDLGRPALPIRVMLRILPREHLDAHAQMAGGLPDRYVGLHEPRCSRVSEGVRRDVSKPGALGCSRKGLAKLLHPAAVIVAHVPFITRGDVESSPASQVRQDTLAEANFRRSLSRIFDRARCPASHNAGSQIDPTPLHPQDGTGSAASVERQQNKSSE